MKTFFCLVAFATAFIQVQKQIKPEVARLNGAHKSRVPESLLREVWKN